MKGFIKKHWKFLLFVLIGGAIGGYCTGLYLPEVYSEQMLKQLQEQNITAEALALSGMLQYGLLYGVVLAMIGIVLSSKVCLWREFRFSSSAVKATAVITIIAALILFPGDKLVFGAFSSWVADQYKTSPGLPKILAGLLVGGITEEVMLRLFFMSLLVWIISRLFCRDKAPIPAAVFVIANILSALMFAAGHLPATAAMTTLTPLILFRCLLLNGGIGLCFGFLYRKYGITYAMLAHGLAHLISDILMILFI